MLLRSNFEFTVRLERVWILATRWWCALHLIQASFRWVKLEDQQFESYFKSWLPRLIAVDVLSRNKRRIRLRSTRAWKSWPSWTRRSATWSATSIPKSARNTQRSDEWRAISKMTARSLQDLERSNLTTVLSSEIHYERASDLNFNLNLMKGWIGYVAFYFSTWQMT